MAIIFFCLGPNLGCKLPALFVVYTSFGALVALYTSERFHARDWKLPWVYVHVKACTLSRMHTHMYIYGQIIRMVKNDSVLRIHRYKYIHTWNSRKGTQKDNSHKYGSNLSPVTVSMVKVCSATGVTTSRNAPALLMSLQHRRKPLRAHSKPGLFGRVCMCMCVQKWASICVYIDMLDVYCECVYVCA